MSTYYKVTCGAENVEKSYTRDTVERAYYLYKQCKEDGETDIKLEEISDNFMYLNEKRDDSLGDQKNRLFCVS